MRGHLRDAVDIEIARLRALLAAEVVVLPAFDGVAYARERLYQYDDPGRILAALRSHCTYVAELVGHLSESDWERTGEHEEAGAVAVQSRIGGLVDHGTEHIRPLEHLRQQVSPTAPT